MGGKDDLENLVLLCSRCHMAISPVPDFVMERVWGFRANGSVLRLYRRMVEDALA